MELIGKLKEDVEKAENKEEAKKMVMLAITVQANKARIITFQMNSAEICPPDMELREKMLPFGLNPPKAHPNPTQISTYVLIRANV